MRLGNNNAAIGESFECLEGVGGRGLTALGSRGQLLRESDAQRTDDAGLGGDVGDDGGSNVGLF